MASNQQGEGAWGVGGCCWALSLLGPPAHSTSRQADCQQAPVSSIDRSLENMVGRPRLDSLSSVEEDDYDTLADIESDKNVIRTKVAQGELWGCGRRCP
ncbi:hypothetical protein E2320_007238 [Naja naja]|nr:hypothetical protein E2320_007238 [Naja naja]